MQELMTTDRGSDSQITQMLTPKDYLTITSEGIFLDAQPAIYYGVPLYKSFCVYEELIKRLVKRFPNVRAVHCMVSKKTPQYIEHPSSYGYDKYDVLRFSVDDPVKTFGFNKWFRIQLIDGTNTPWYCTSRGIKKSQQNQKLSDEIWEDMFQNGGGYKPGFGTMMGRFIEVDVCARLLPSDVLACALCDENILRMLEFLNCNPSLIPGRVVEGCQLIQQKQLELLNSAQTLIPGRVVEGDQLIQQEQPELVKSAQKKWQMLSIFVQMLKEYNKRLLSRLFGGRTK